MGVAIRSLFKNWTKLLLGCPAHLPAMSVSWEVSAVHRRAAASSGPPAEACECQRQWWNLLFEKDWWLLICTLIHTPALLRIPGLLDGEVPTTEDSGHPNSSVKYSPFEIF